MPGPNEQGQVISAARFRLELPGHGALALSEVSGIKSTVGTIEYIYNDDKGQTRHTKQFGKTDPPSVTVKRGLDLEGNDVLLRWHGFARDGDRLKAVIQSVSLVISDASGAAASEVTYLLENAWCQELTVSPMKAGDGQVSYIEAKITCDRILSGSVQFKSS
ncbi:phage tail protein [Amycolatopsis sp. H20-H5]|uniref:phage tail protein n=1 Tax=Amycolatopsis sp. H20-H5 TaxID=3046309 RepID=UPI002DB8DD59|nr:phage tail protein [Amycolatopsis sp. H20-H5]MEC3978757.1 phage tail protein [Amycolatopsis sp. H20-H5]